MSAASRASQDLKGLKQGERGSLASQTVDGAAVSLLTVVLPWQAKRGLLGSQ
jgi:hypothetical protein